MIIQPLLFSQKEICTDQKMYYRINENKISLETYFNAFSIGKWKKYTNIKNLYLEVESEEDLKFICMAAEGKCNKSYQTFAVQTEDLSKYVSVKRKKIPFDVTRKNGKYVIDFKELPDEGILYVLIKCTKKIYDIKNVITGGGYGTHTDPSFSPVLALGICTYKREECLGKNINLILENIINNTDSVLYNKLEVFISDNGQSLKENIFENDRVHIFSNKNAGGAGGFTRCMIEALFRGEKKRFTHIILMDDDILLDTTVLERTYLFLSFISEKYQKAIVGGEMFELNRKYMQFEAGGCACWNNNYYFHRFYNMNNRDFVSTNEEESNINYSGWWYNCIPVTEINEANLPIPAFIHYDDIEYGIRHMKNGIILINGICVWHPQFPGKAPANMIYYDVRNSLIAQAVSNQKEKFKLSIIKRLTKMIGTFVSLYRYNETECVFKGYEDFHKGPEFFLSLDPVENHKDLSKYNYSYDICVDEKIREDIKYKKIEPKWKMVIKAIVSMLCWVLPSKNKTKITNSTRMEFPFTYKRVLFYDDTKNVGCISERDYKKAVYYFIKYFDCICKIILFYDRDMDRWYHAKENFTSLEFWEKYLELENNK